MAGGRTGYAGSQSGGNTGRQSVAQAGGTAADADVAGPIVWMPGQHERAVLFLEPFDFGVRLRDHLYGIAIGHDVDHADAGGQPAVNVSDTLPQRGSERSVRNDQNACHVSVTAKNGWKSGDRAL